tara:strand:+ start:957 stop:1505 length:549 start_codon:yes stop_codon:yes gene_type:complete
MSATILEFRRKESQRDTDFVDQLSLNQRQRITRITRKLPGRTSEPSGAYNMPIIVSKGVRRVHTAGRYIEMLHGIRVEGAEVIRYDCEPLSLAVYVYPGAMTDEGEIQGYVVKTFDFKNTKPTQVISAQDVTELVFCLQGILATTLTRVRAHSDLSELSRDEIVLLNSSLDTITLPAESIKC